MNKKLSEMTLQELWQIFPIYLTEHQACWETQYKEEVETLHTFLPSYVQYFHIGSTAIADIWAKPIVDILLVVQEPSQMQPVADRLHRHGYLCMATSATRISFNKGYTEHGFAQKVFHLHVRLPGDTDEIYFCAYLNAHPDVAKAYEQLKLRLWKQYEHNRDAYTQAKTEFVRKYTALAKQTTD